MSTYELLHWSEDFLLTIIVIVAQIYQFIFI